MLRGQGHTALLKVSVVGLSEQGRRCEADLPGKGKAFLPVPTNCSPFPADTATKSDQVTLLTLLLLFAPYFWLSARPHLLVQASVPLSFLSTLKKWHASSHCAVFSYPSDEDAYPILCLEYFCSWRLSSSDLPSLSPTSVGSVLLLYRLKNIMTTSFISFAYIVG